MNISHWLLDRVAQVRWILPLLVGVAVLAIAGAAAGAGARPAACSQWNVTGTWHTAQGNNYHVTFHFSQTGTTVGGIASLSPSEQAAAGYISPNARISGTLKGIRISVKTFWKAPSSTIIGLYGATVSRGKLVGNGRAITTPVAGAVVWSGTGPTRCVRAG